MSRLKGSWVNTTTI